jgi:deazaflavin-dependent oxidoreductase (nitroreductase family)
MVGPLITLVGLVLAALVVTAATFVIGMRRKSPVVTGAVIALTKRFINPGALQTAGQSGAKAGVVHHRGRTTGAAYATPVDIIPAGDAFLIALPYGTRAQWVRNVLAAGSAELTVDGTTWMADRPELVPTDQVQDAFPRSDRLGFRLLGTDRCLRLRRGEAISDRPAA